MSQKPEWTAELDAAATARAGASSRLQKVDEKGTFATDAAAWGFVVEQAGKGDPVALAALHLLEANSPPEWRAILKPHNLAEDGRIEVCWPR
jgi:hypothetical protein